MNKDPYTVLGVSRQSTPEQIKSAFHALAKVHHPDKGGSAERFKEISAAYTEIKDRKPEVVVTRKTSNYKGFRTQGTNSAYERYHAKVKSDLDAEIDRQRKEVVDILKRKFGNSNSFFNGGSFGI